MSDEISHLLFAGFPVGQSIQTSIVIPVRDEAENIIQTLTAFTGQIDFDGKLFDFERFEVLMLANNCVDNSAEIIRKFGRENPQLNLYVAEIESSADDANIGFVRRVLMDAAFVRLPKNGVIMTTDGDTIVADDWIAANLREIKNGADAVGGRILMTDAELEKMDAFSRETHLLDEEYRLLLAEIESAIDDLPFDSAPRHHQHFNGSFACTTAIYEKAGGIPDVKFLEDIAFFERLQRMDAKVRHSSDVRVFTSSRREGRSEVGLSFQLNLWKNLNESGEDFLVEPAESIVERFSIKKVLREIWRDYSGSKVIEDVSKRMFIAPEFILRELEKCQTFGAFYENLMIEQNRVGKWSRKFPLVKLEKALEDLKQLTADGHR